MITLDDLKTRFTHRIGDLETKVANRYDVQRITHRIGDLEIFQTTAFYFL